MGLGVKCSGQGSALLAGRSWLLMSTEMLPQRSLGVVPLDEGPSQVARDGEDFAILMLSRNALLGGRVTVHVDCEGTLGCASALPSTDGDPAR